MDDATPSRRTRECDDAADRQARYEAALRAVS